MRGVDMESVFANIRERAICRGEIERNLRSFSVDSKPLPKAISIFIGFRTLQNAIAEKTIKVPIEVIGSTSIKPDKITISKTKSDAIITKLVITPLTNLSTPTVTL